MPAEPIEAGGLDVGSEGKTEKPRVTPKISGLKVAMCFGGESTGG